MKNSTLIIALMSIGFGLNAQKNINLKINHQLESSPFAFSQKSTNDLNKEFTFVRCEYYISKISIVHDGGKISNAAGVYELVEATSNTSIDLGSYAITQVEAINFSIGVDPANNNGDPTKWPRNHALAPKSPSMHWGWSAGYRFAAIEGKSGNNMRTTWEVHALGNKNYFNINIPTEATSNNGALDITLNADYTKALNGLKVDNGFITHGEDDEAYIVLRNFQNKVFTSTDGKGNTLNTISPVALGKVNVFPNPCNGSTIIGFEKPLTGTINILDMSGRLVQSFAAKDHKAIKVESLRKGMYTVQIIDYGKNTISKKLFVN